MIIKNRSRVDILYDIISAAKLGCKKTHLMYQGNLSFQQLESYLGLTLRNGLLTERYVEETRLYFATEKGLRFLSAVEDVKDLLTVKSSKNDETGLFHTFSSVVTGSENPAKIESVEESAY